MKDAVEIVIKQATKTGDYKQGVEDIMFLFKQQIKQLSRLKSLEEYLNE